MENNIKAIQQKRLLILDPNPDGNQILPNEDMNIIVELNTTMRSRNLITVASNGGATITDNNQGQIVTGPIKFIAGSDYGNGKSLTTNYTEGGFFSPNESNDLNDGRDKESLGIQNIDISFDTAYTPIIKIKFIDVRGNAIFTQGDKSKYAAFFNMPYPIFELTVKGYFGKAVKYCLHLKKFNSRFNSQTGNFEIDAEFIGYTYALLTDMLLGLLRAVIKTEEGKPHWDRKLQEYASRGIPLKSMDEFMRDIPRIADEFQKIKNDDVNVQELNGFSEATDALNSIEQRLISLVTYLKEKDEDYINTGDGLIIIPEKKSTTPTVTEKIKNYTKEVSDYLDNSDINNKISSFNINKGTLTTIINIPPIKGVYFKNEGDAVPSEDPNLPSNNLQDLIKQNYPNSISEEEAKNLTEKILDSFKIGLDNINEEDNLVIYDLRKIYEEISTLRSKIASGEKSLREKIAADLASKVENQLGYLPSIRNIIGMICAQIETFIDTMESVSVPEKTTNNSERNDILKKIWEENPNDSLNIKNSEMIYPWPEYRTCKDEGEKGKVCYEDWLGDNEYVTGNISKIPELLFTEHMLAALLELVKEDEIATEAENGVKGPQYYPVSVLDTYFANPTIMTNMQINPYYVALTDTYSKALPEEISRCLLMRGFLSLGVTNRTGLGQITSETMGKLEAENVFEALNNLPSKTKVRELIDAFLTAYPDANKIVDGWKTGYDNISNPTDTKKALLEQGKDEIGIDTYEYTYIMSDDVLKRRIIPISSGFDGKVFYENGNLKVNQQLLDVAKTVHFTNNMIGSSFWRIRDYGVYTYNGVTHDASKEFWDDGSTLFDIIKAIDFEGFGILPKYGGDLINAYRTNPIISQNGQFINQTSLLKPAYSVPYYAELVSNIPYPPSGLDKDNFMEQVLYIAPYFYEKNVLEIKHIDYNGLYSDDVDKTPEKSGDSGNEKIHYKTNAPNNVSNVLCAYFYQDAKAEYGDVELGGTHLAYALNPSNADEKIIIDKYHINDEDKPFKLLTSPSNKASQQSSKKEYKLNSYGKTRELLGDVIGTNDREFQKENLNTDAYIPSIEFAISNHEDYSEYTFSLFGSPFYYIQTTLQARAFLFLHTFAWNGLVGDNLDTLTKKDSRDYSLFDLVSLGSQPAWFALEDDSPTLKNLFTNNGSFIRAPKLWIAFIGGLLYRYKIKKESNKDLIRYTPDGGPNTYVLPWQDVQSHTPTHLQLLHDRRAQCAFGMNFVFDSNDSGVFGDRDDRGPNPVIVNGTTVYDGSNNEQNYIGIENSLLGLPKSVKDKFINYFLDFCKNDFNPLRAELELTFNEYDSTDEDKISYSLNDYNNWKTKWNAVYNARKKTEETYTINPAFKEPKEQKQTVTTNYYTLKKSDLENSGLINIKNYVHIAPVDNSYFSSTFRAYHYNLLIKPGTPTSNKLKNLIGSYEYLMIGAPEIFRATSLENVNLHKNGYKPIRCYKKHMDFYLQGFISRFTELSTSWKEIKEAEQDKYEQKLFNSTDDSFIRLQLYRTLSHIYSKWITGGENANCSINGFDKEYAGGNEPLLIDSFRFLDRAYNDIGNEFMINPMYVQDLIRNNWNTSAFDFFNDILSFNNFNFIPLPNFINFHNVNEIKDIFTPFTYKDYAEGEITSGPSFVCVYIGDGSNNLDMGEASEYPDDGIVIQKDSSGNYIGFPADFLNESSNTDKKEHNIPFVLVNYGIQNQHFFKEIKIGQDEFTETMESLQIIEDISNGGDKSKPTYRGQNLWNIYSNRAYTVEIEMMGNAMIQPFMYFYLNNIPMFKGAYTVYKVSHTITANHMSTSFTGNRVKRTRTPIMDKETMFMNLLGSLDSMGSSGTGGINGSSIRGKTGMNDSRVQEQGSFVTYQVKESDSIKYQQRNPNGEGDDYAMEAVGKFIEDLANQWHQKYKDTEFSDYLYINCFGAYAGGTNKTHGDKGPGLHGVGRAVDIHPMLKTKKLDNYKVGQSNYSSEQNQALFEMAIALSESNKHGVKFDNIILNDDKIIEYFKNKGKTNSRGQQLVISYKGHSNHIHMEWEIPDDVKAKLDKGEKGAAVSDAPIASNGVAGTINNNKATIPGEQDKLKFLGKV